MIILKNKGEIDVETIKTMGVNVKEGENCIGHFGTGLKYAIAVFLREGIDLKLWIGTNEYEFFTEPKIIRGISFDLCYMSGPYDTTPLGFTTQLGKNWEVWQAYREIHSNCLDEDGEIKHGDYAHKKEGHTIFNLPDLDGIDDIFLGGMDLTRLFENHRIEIYEGESKYIYYKGIRAKDISHQPSLYTYNILADCTLTEDRLLCYDFQVEHAINDSVAEMEGHKDLVKDIITAKDSYESGIRMNNNCYEDLSNDFVEVYEENIATVNSSVKEYVAKKTPAPELTPEQLAVKLRQDITNLCEVYDIGHEIADGIVTLMAERILA